MLNNKLKNPLAYFYQITLYTYLVGLILIYTQNRAKAEEDYAAINRSAQKRILNVQINFPESKIIQNDYEERIVNSLKKSWLKNNPFPPTSPKQNVLINGNFVISAKGELKKIDLDKDSKEDDYSDKKILAKVIEQATPFYPLPKVYLPSLKVNVSIQDEIVFIDKAIDKKLDSKIAEANSKEYMKFYDHTKWSNPFIVINNDHSVTIKAFAKPNRVYHVQIALIELPSFLISLPLSAWPYGKVVGLSINGVGGASDSDRIWVEKILKNLNLKILPWPYA